MLSPAQQTSCKPERGVWGSAQIGSRSLSPVCTFPNLSSARLGLAGTDICMLAMQRIRISWVPSFTLINIEHIGECHCPESINERAEKHCWLARNWPCTKQVLVPIRRLKISRLLRWERWCSPSEFSTWYTGSQKSSAALSWYGFPSSIYNNLYRCGYMTPTR